MREIKMGREREMVNRNMRDISLPAPRRQGIRLVSRVSCLLLGLACLCGRPLLGTSVIPISDAELYQRADVIVHGVVLTSDVTVDDLGRPETVTVIEPMAVLKGRLAGSLVLHQLGGTLPDGRFFKLWGRPEYAPGREVVVFAIARPQGEYQTAELLLGKFEVWQDETGKLFAVPDLAAGVHSGVEVLEKPQTLRLSTEVDSAAVVDGDSGRPLAREAAQDEKLPRELASFLASLRTGVFEASPSVTPSGSLEPAHHAQERSGRVTPEWGNIADSLFRWNNNATATWTISGTANMDGGGFAEAQAALASWTNDPNSTINYVQGSGTSNVIYVNATSSILGCGWTTCLTGGGVIGCGGPTGVGGSNTWRGETYTNITQGVAELRASCVHNGFGSTITQSVLTHELGHTLGLGHSDQNVSTHDVCRGDESAATMRAVVQNRTTLGTDDQDAIRWLYGDGGNSCTPILTPPAVTTGAAGSIGMTGAVLNASVNPEGGSTTVYFEYGTTTSYGSTTAAQAIGSGTLDVTVSQPTGSLICGTLYHFRAVATNGFGTTRGLDRTFSTSACTPAGFYTLSPCRLADTRSASGPMGGPSLVAGASRSLTLAGQCGIPAGAQAVSVNVTVVQPTAGPGFLTLYPGGTSLPVASTVNYSAGQIRGNNVIVPLGSAGDILVWCGQGGGTADMVIDVNGYFQ
jgi:hypothetical protein